MEEVVIEIDGVRHKLNKDVVVCGCPACSLDEQCQGAEWCFCSPFLMDNEYGHFELEPK